MQTSQMKKQPKSRKLGMTFHRSFALNRPAIGQILSIAGQVKSIGKGGKCLTNADIRNQTSLGTIYVEAMPRYARATGLLTEGNCLTDFGRIVLDSDPILSRIGTQWLLHYYLSVEHGIGPSFWNNTVTSCFQIGNQLPQAQVTDIIHEHTNSTGQSVSLDSAKQTTTAFLGTYTKDDGLGSLQILETKERDVYAVLQPTPPPAWAFAYAMIDYWECNYKDRLSVNLNDLSSQNGLASLFLMDDSAINTTLSELQRAGFVDVYRSAHPYQVLLLSHDKVQALRNLYGVH